MSGLHGERVEVSHAQRDGELSRVVERATGANSESQAGVGGRRSRSVG